MTKKSHILCKTSEYEFNIKILDKKCHIIYKLLQKMLKNTLYDEETNSIFLKVETLVPLQQHLKDNNYKLPYEKCIKIKLIYIRIYFKQIFLILKRVLFLKIN